MSMERDDVRSRKDIFCRHTFTLSPLQRVRSRRLAEEKLGFNFELEQLERSIHYVDLGADTKDGVTIVPGADGGEKAGEEPSGNSDGGRLVGRSPPPPPSSSLSLSLGRTLENKKNHRTMGAREKNGGWEKEREGEPDGGFVTNGDAAATHEAKVPALVPRLYTGRRKFRPLPIKP